MSALTGCLAALLAHLLPSRGRHSGSASPAAAGPEDPAADAEDERVDLTMFDLPTGRVPPYVWPGDEDGAP